MIDGLRLTIPGEELRALLLARIRHHEQCAKWWTRQKTRTPEDDADWAALRPDHICSNEAEQHVWRGDVLTFIRDHVEAGATYRLGAADLEFGELLPARPDWLAQDEYEERTRIGFALERLVRSVDGLAGATYGWRHRHEPPEDPEGGAPRPGVIGETDEFKAGRVDADGGPEAILIERK